MRSGRLLLPAGVAALTYAITLAAAAAAGGPAGGLLPLLLPPLWGWLVLRQAEPRLPLLAAAAWLAAAGLTAPPPATLVVAAYVLAGLGVGRVLLADGRLDAALLAAAAPLAALSLWAMVGLPLADLLAESGRDLAATLERGLPAGLDEAARQAATARIEREVAAVGRALLRIWPALLALGLLSQAALTVLLVRWLGGRWGRVGRLRPLPSPARWRLPFYVVWALVAGLALLALRRDPAAGAGLNLVIVAAALLTLQGLSVQVDVVARALSPWGRALFWILAALFLAPVLLAASVLLGLVDQWLDLRRLAGGGPPAA